MEKMTLLRSIYRSSCFRSSRFASLTNHQLIRRSASRSLFTLSSPSAAAPPLSRAVTEFRSPFAMGIGSMRCFSEDVTHMPDMKDPEIVNVFKDLMAASWDEIPDAVVYDAKKALSKSTDDKAGQEALKNVFVAAEAVEEFGGMIMSLKLILDEEDAKPLSDELGKSLTTFFERYTAYLGAFGPDEVYLKKKVENELGSKMIFLKMRCSGLDAEWGKVTLLGTSGIAGSYVEQRA